MSCQWFFCAEYKLDFIYFCIHYLNESDIESDIDSESEEE